MLALLRSIPLLVLTFAFTAPALAQASPTPPSNPHTAPVGAATMHGDSMSSDTTGFPGPGTGSITVTTAPLAAACPAALVGGDGMPVILCTKIVDRSPQVVLLDPSTGLPLATLDLPKGGLFGGVYTYLDRQDRMVLVSADGNLVWIGHHRTATGTWSLTIDKSVPVGSALPAGDGVIGISPDWRGRVWFATEGGVVGLYDPKTDKVNSLRLGTGEKIENSISTAPGVTAIATDHALYELSGSRKGRPFIRWRRAYDRGPARKPGQLSFGTGATPTYFGPKRGAELLAITDNASPQENLLVYRSVGPMGLKKRASGRKGKRKRARPRRPELVCRIPVLTGGSSGTENSPIGYGRSVIVASTFGYPYPAYPEGAGESVPATAPFAGGMTRVDIDHDGRGCKLAWTNAVRSSAVPKLDVADNLLYTMTRANPLGGTATSQLDVFSFTAVDPDDGQVISSTPFGAGFAYETLQLAGNVAPDGALYQGTITGILRIAGN